MLISQKQSLIGFLLCALVSASYSAAAQQRLEMEGTAIIGNKELPKVLYIVPWKPAQTVKLDTPTFQSVLDEPFHPVERTSFKRQVQFYQDIYHAQENTTQDLQKP